MDLDHPNSPSQRDTPVDSPGDDAPQQGTPNIMAMTPQPASQLPPPPLVPTPERPLMDGDIPRLMDLTANSPPAPPHPVERPLPPPPQHLGQDLAQQHPQGPPVLATSPPPPPVPVSGQPGPFPAPAAHQMREEPEIGFTALGAGDIAAIQKRVTAEPPRARSPSPPRALFRSTTGKGVAFTTDDVEFLVRLYEYRR
jgi:hypothetical protein